MQLGTPLFLLLLSAQHASSSVPVVGIEIYTSPTGEASKRCSSGTGNPDWIVNIGSTKCYELTVGKVWLSFSTNVACASGRLPELRAQRYSREGCLGPPQASAAVLPPGGGCVSLGTDLAVLWVDGVGLRQPQYCSIFSFYKALENGGGVTQEVYVGSSNCTGTASSQVDNVKYIYEDLVGPECWSGQVGECAPFIDRKTCSLARTWGFRRIGCRYDGPARTPRVGHVVSMYNDAACSVPFAGLLFDPGTVMYYGECSESAPSSSLLTIKPPMTADIYCQWVEASSTFRPELLSAADWDAAFGPTTLVRPSPLPSTPAPQTLPPPLPSSEPTSWVVPAAASLCCVAFVVFLAALCYRCQKPVPHRHLDTTIELSPTACRRELGYVQMTEGRA